MFGLSGSIQAQAHLDNAKAQAAAAQNAG